MKSISRREFLLGSAAIAGVSVISGNASTVILTPRASEGPFYPKPPMRFPDIDNDLIKIAGMVKQAGGEIILLKGRMMNRDGQPLAGHRIEIWQCDVNGRYLHPRDRRNIPYDTGFQGFGHDITDNNGRYSFRTIKPAKYPGRAPHIHVKVSDGKRELLNTQFYIAGHSDNDGDFLFRRMSVKQAKTVSMVFHQSNDILETSIDVVV